VPWDRGGVLDIAGGGNGAFAGPCLGDRNDDGGDGGDSLGGGGDDGDDEEEVINCRLPALPSCRGESFWGGAGLDP